MSIQAANRPFSIIPLALLLALFLLPADPVRPETPQVRETPWTISAFSNWVLAHNDNDFTLRTVSLNNPAVLLQLANTFEERIVNLPETFGISLELVDKDMAKFDEGDYENCEIFVDGVGYRVHVARNGDSINIKDKSLAKALLASRHEQFVISFPDLAISYTFPLTGLKAAFNRVKYLHLQLELEKRSEAIEIFSRAGSIFILIAASGGIVMFLYSRSRKKPSGSAGKREEKPREKPLADKKAAQGKDKAKTGKSKTAQGSHSRSSRQESGYRATYDSGGRSRATSSGARDDFYERANFGNPFGSSPSSASLPADVRAALEFFNLPQTTTFAEIRDKRTFLLKAYHPDRFQGDDAAMKMAEEQTKKVNLNFDILDRHYGKKN